MAFYEVTLNGRAGGQDVKNILWYRDIIPAVELGEFLDLLGAINATVRDQIWRSQSPLHVRGLGLQEVMPASYTLTSISTKAFNADFTLVSDTPVELAVNEVGGMTGNFGGLDRCVILRANLEPSFGPGIGLPKRGYLAVGPVMEGYMTDDGHIESTAIAGWTQLGSNLATNIETTLPPTVLFPIRVRLTYVGHVVTLITWKDVSNFIPNAVMSTRKSRRPEA